MSVNLDNIQRIFKAFDRERFFIYRDMSILYSNLSFRRSMRTIQTILVIFEHDLSVITKLPTKFY